MFMKPKTSLPSIAVFLVLLVAVGAATGCTDKGTDAQKNAPDAVAAFTGKAPATEEYNKKRAEVLQKMKESQKPGVNAPK